MMEGTKRETGFMEWSNFAIISNELKLTPTH